ncbi:MAG: iron-containing alcohol dehydrogenase [Acidobacteriota bacterium]|nr:MAG: iron-containing alcohol dehydrogenase [Acidobacteriota bacterium]
MGEGVIDSVAELVPPAARLQGPVLLLADPDTYDAAGARVRAVLSHRGHSVRVVKCHRRPKADQSTLAALVSQLSGSPSRIVAVGSGTISDLGKLLAQHVGIPLVTVGTAASMNGYLSTIAAITAQGLKKTQPTLAPEALLLDTRVLADAPARLNRAGFGDLLSKPVSGADWLLSGFFFGELVCPAAMRIVDEAVERTRRLADGIARQQPAALACLAEALVLSGVSMALAGSSSPASGGEHLLSHYLDISAEGWSREPFLHGEQVAVGTLVSLALYERIRRSGPESITTGTGDGESERELRLLHGQLPPAPLEALLAEARAKASRQPGREQRLALLADHWSELWHEIDWQLEGGRAIADDLRRAKVPCTFADIDVPPERASALIRRAHHMRNRFTVLDLAADLGLLASAAEELAVGP